MRTTLNLNTQLFHDAVRATGIQEKTKLIHMGLSSLVREAALRRIAKLHGVYKKAKAPRRRKLV